MCGDSFLCIKLWRMCVCVREISVAASDYFVINTFQDQSENQHSPHESKEKKKNSQYFLQRRLLVLVCGTCSASNSLLNKCLNPVLNPKYYEKLSVASFVNILKYICDPFCFHITVRPNLDLCHVSCSP